MSKKKSLPADIGAAQRESTASRFFTSASSPGEEEARTSARPQKVSATRLSPHPDQPVDRHAAEAVAELMQSIQAHGLLQAPLVMRRGSKFVILAGHRRVRAYQLLALDGLVEEKLTIFVRDDLSDADAVYLMCGEAHHRKDFSPVHAATLVGKCWVERSGELGRDASARDLADVLPSGKTCISESMTIYRALKDPRLAPLVRSADSAGKDLLVKALRLPDLSTQERALTSYADGGSPALRKALVTKTGRPQKTVTQRKRGDHGYDLTIRIRKGMAADEVNEAREALKVAEETLLRISEAPAGDSISH